MAEDGGRRRRKSWEKKSRPEEEWEVEEVEEDILYIGRKRI